MLPFHTINNVAGWPSATQWGTSISWDFWQGSQLGADSGRRAALLLFHPPSPAWNTDVMAGASTAILWLCRQKPWTQDGRLEEWGDLLPAGNCYPIEYLSATLNSSPTYTPAHHFGFPWINGPWPYCTLSISIAFKAQSPILNNYKALILCGAGSISSSFMQMLEIYFLAE